MLGDGILHGLGQIRHVEEACVVTDVGVGGLGVRGQGKAKAQKHGPSVEARLVFVVPGQTQLTRTPCCPYSTAIARVSEMMAPLAAV